MKVKIRHIFEADSVLFTECQHNELQSVISLIKEASGFYYDGEQQEFNSFQLVINEGEAYAEIIIGDDE